MHMCMRTCVCACLCVFLCECTKIFIYVVKKVTYRVLLYLFILFYFRRYYLNTFFFLKKPQHIVKETFNLHYIVWMKTYAGKEKQNTKPHFYENISLEAGLSCSGLYFFLILLISVPMFPFCFVFLFLHRVSLFTLKNNKIKHKLCLFSMVFRILELCVQTINI